CVPRAPGQPARRTVGAGSIWPHRGLMILLAFRHRLHAAESSDQVDLKLRICTVAPDAAPTGCTFVFDWELDSVVVEPARGFSAAVCVGWMLNFGPHHRLSDETGALTGFRQLAPEVLEARRRQLCVAHSVLDA